MRRVEQRMCAAMVKGDNLRAGHDEVVTQDGVSTWFLFGNEIVSFERTSGQVTLMDAGWQTVTTKSRLNAAGRWLISYRFALWQADNQWYRRLGSCEVHPWKGSVRLYASDGMARADDCTCVACRIRRDGSGGQR